MAQAVCGHKVEREIEDELWYRCVDCGLGGDRVDVFDKYGCPPQGRNT